MKESKQWKEVFMKINVYYLVGTAMYGIMLQAILSSSSYQVNNPARYTIYYLVGMTMNRIKLHIILFSGIGYELDNNTLYYLVEVAMDWIIR